MLKKKKQSSERREYKQVSGEQFNLLILFGRQL